MSPNRVRNFFLLACALLLLAPAGADVRASGAQTTAARTPTEVVREFYKAMRERRFRDAFAMSVFRPAIDGLSTEEFEELRPEFEKVAASVPETVEIAGEQISGNVATVFMKHVSDPAAPTEKVELLRAGGAWIIGDQSNQEAVKKSGKEFFFKAQIDVHHSEVTSMLPRIAAAQLVYSSQHDGQFTDLETLVRAGLVPRDILTTDSTGYRFHITVAKGGKTYTAGAEPARYGRTGRLSFFMDPSGIKSKDTGGKPLDVLSTKK